MQLGNLPIDVRFPADPEIPADQLLGVLFGVADGSQDIGATHQAQLVLGDHHCRCPGHGSIWCCYDEIATVPLDAHPGQVCPATIIQLHQYLVSHACQTITNGPEVVMT
jgi:hypothetical protein